LGKPTSMASDQRRTLARLSGLIREHRLYLAGGVAVAWHVHHRRSLDIDLFSRDAECELESFRDAVAGRLRGTRVAQMTDATLRLDVEGTAVDVVRYPYALLEEPTPGPEGVAVAGLRDLATMKLAAIARRGIRRDFWDLHEIMAHGVPLARALDDYVVRYGVSHSDLYHVLRALTYFEDAEQETVWPAGLTPRRWQTIRSRFERVVPAEFERRI
jgi:hypothetical protein